MMKKASCYFSPLLALLLLVSCEQDTYDKGDSKYSNMRADFVEAYAGKDKRVEYVVTDDDIHLALTAAYTASWIQRADTTYRAVLFYNYAGEKAEAISMSRVSTASVHRSDAFKSGIKTDPVGVETIWLSGNKRYLNLRLILMTGTADDEKAEQTVGMIGDTITSDAEGLRTCQLRLFHNQNSVPQYYSQRAYISVPVDKLGADSLQLSVNTYNGVISRGFRLRP